MSVQNKAIAIFTGLGFESAAKDFETEAAFLAADESQVAENILKSVRQNLRNNKEFIAPIQEETRAAILAEIRANLAKHLTEIPAETLQNTPIENLFEIGINKERSKLTTDQKQLLQDLQDERLAKAAAKTQLEEQERRHAAQISAMRLQNAFVKALGSFKLTVDPEMITPGLLQRIEDAGLQIGQGDTEFPVKITKKGGDPVTVGNTLQVRKSKELLQEFLEASGVLGKNNVGGEPTGQGATINNAGNSVIPNQNNAGNRQLAPIDPAMAAAIAHAQRMGAFIEA